jgi:hypothetical protein
MEEWKKFEEKQREEEEKVKCDKHDWKYSNDGEVKYCTKCNEREWA